jgi:hypothetical protein
MIGEYVMRQKDLQEELTKVDAIGMGSYNSDSHNVQRIVNSQGFVENEGDMQVRVKPYQIPYRMIVPKLNEAENLLVPVCFSATPLESRRSWRLTPRSRSRRSTQRHFGVRSRAKARSSRTSLRHKSG